MSSIIYLEKYIISKLDDNQIVITINKDGEGGTFDIKDFERVVDKFYKDNF